MEPHRQVLAVNAGSSSLKISSFGLGPALLSVGSVKVDEIGSGHANMTTRFGVLPRDQLVVPAATHEEALKAAIASLREHPHDLTFEGVGHRIVHGGPNYFEPTLIDDAVLNELRSLEPFDPEHLPAQVSLIESLMAMLPGVPHIACFDTAFHHDLPPVAKRLPIPRRFDAIGVRRYGFHGLSYAYLMGHLRHTYPVEAEGRVILAHLGNGASLAAVYAGRCMDTSMAFTPAAGVPMGTRSGDLDPGLIDYLVRVGGITVEQFNRLVHLESGMLGISETTADVRKLLELRVTDARAGEAIDSFCYNVRKCIGSYAAALGGLDTLVFSGGIGENSSEVRAQICAGLEFLGISLDETLNQAHAALISSPEARVKVRVIPTDEEQMIARIVVGKLGSK